MNEKPRRGGLRVDNPGGRPFKPIGERAAYKGKIPIRISIEAAADLQQLMLRFVEGVNSPEQMVEYLIRKDLNMNDAAKKLVARSARAAAHEMRDRARLGANIDTLATEAWEHVSNDEYRQWTGAREYFEAVFVGMINTA